MAKTVITAESDFGELVTDMLKLAKDFPDVIFDAAESQLQVLEAGIQTNWSSMVPHAQVGDYVYDSIGYNVDNGDRDSDVVGMAGVFLVDSVGNKHGKNVQKKDHTEQIKAPQLAYWTEFGYTPNHGATQVGIPFMGNAYHATLDEQDKVFADTLSAAISKRMTRL